MSDDSSHHSSDDSSGDSGSSGLLRPRSDDHLSLSTLRRAARWETFAILLGLIVFVFVFG